VGCEARTIRAEGDVFFLDFPFYRTYKTRGDCKTERKSYKASHFVGWIVGWEGLFRTERLAFLATVVLFWSSLIASGLPVIVPQSATCGHRVSAFPLQSQLKDDRQVRPEIHVLFSPVAIKFDFEQRRRFRSGCEFRFQLFFVTP